MTSVNELEKNWKNREQREKILTKTKERPGNKYRRPSLQSTVARLKYGNYGGARASRKWEMARCSGSRELRNIQSRYAFDCKPFKPAIKCNDFRRVRVSTGAASFFHAAIP